MNKFKYINQDIIKIISKYLMISKEDVKFNFNKVIKPAKEIYDTDISKMSLYFELNRIFKNKDIKVEGDFLLTVEYVYKTNEELNYFINNFECFQYNMYERKIRIYISACDIPYKDLLLLSNRHQLHLRSIERKYKSFNKIFVL